MTEKNELLSFLQQESLEEAYSSIDQCFCLLIVEKTKRTGPRTDPCGTPHQAGIDAELQFGQLQSDSV